MTASDGRLAWASGGFLAGVFAASAGSYVATHGEPAAPPAAAAGAAAPDRAAAAAPAATSGSRDAELAQRLQALADRLAALDAKIDADRSPREPADPQRLAVDADSLQAAMAEVERRKWDAMPYAELLAEVRVHLNGRDGAAARVRLESLRARGDLTPEQRDEADTTWGMFQRGQGEAGAVESARVLQAVIDRNGFDTDRGLAAAYQMLWTRSEQRDFARARDLGAAIARSPGANASLQLSARWAAAIAAANGGDKAAARAEFEALLPLVDRPGGQDWIAKDIRRRLEQL
ncbi:MAG: hypothetical protein U1E73_04835 [Planctomycetota bacterium]